MRIRLLVMIALLSLPAFAQAEVAAHAINGKSFSLTDNTMVRLASIEAPNAPDGRPGEPLGEEAKAFLEKLIAGKEVQLDAAKNRDRHNRILAQAYLPDGTWVQGALLREGYAMEYSFPDTKPALVQAMRKEERSARKSKKGIWANTYYRMITPQEAGDAINRFKLVHGTLMSVNEYHGHIYLNFSKEWKGNFAGFIPRKYAETFSLADLKAMIGKPITLRGWIHWHNAPLMDITHLAQIEVD